MEFTNATSTVKQAVLLALVERIAEQAEQLVSSIVTDRELSAQDKLIRFFAVLDQFKRDNLNLVMGFLRVWYADENALFRHKLYLARIKWLSPLLSQIIHEGLAEGTFTTAYPEQSARMIIALLEDVGYATVELLLVEEGTPIDFPRMAQFVEATIDAMERVLGTQPGCLQQFWNEDLSQWQALLT
jgi:AcrR family transcriptional regulator